jgi:hypothetical protein
MTWFQLAYVVLARGWEVVQPPRFRIL